MKACVAIAFVLTGCVYFDSTADDGGAPIDDPPPADELPPGVWEPMPGAWISNAQLAADGSSVWWATTRRIEPAGEYLYELSVWLTATTPTGRTVVDATQLAPATGASFWPDVVVTPTAILAKGEGRDTLLRRYTRDGQPLGAPRAITVEQNGVELQGPIYSDLVATADGHAQFVATLGYEASEVAIVDLDPDGVPVATTFVGTRDTVEPGGSHAGSLAVAARADGSTLVAWERSYYGCISSKPSATLTAAVDGTTVGAVTAVQDLPGSELSPALAAHGDGAYVAWQRYTDAGTRIALARYTDVTTVAAELGGDIAIGTSYQLALGASDRGALAWTASDGSLHVTPFVDRDGTLRLGTPSVVRTVTRERTGTAVGLVHVGDDRYVLGWIEYGNISLPRDPDRLFATELDFSGAALRPAPPLAPAASQPRARPLRCPL